MLKVGDIVVIMEGCFKGRKGIVSEVINCKYGKCYETTMLASDPSKLGKLTYSEIELVKL